MDVGAWLRGLGLGQYEQAFRDNEIDAEVLPGLTAEDLKDVGVTLVGHRRRLLTAIADLDARPRNRAAAATSAPASAIPEQAAGERRHLTVVFCDLVGSTRLARRLDPEEMREVLLTYHNAVSGEIAHLEGYIAKFMGDGVLAYFGYPVAHEDSAERAIRAALAVREAVTRLVAPTLEHLSVRIGIASGLVVVGDTIGTGTASECAVVGETPNLAARLQSAAAPNEVLVAASTRQLVSDLFRVEETGPLDLRGIDPPVRAFRVIGESSVESRFEARSGGELRPMVGRDHELALVLDRWRIAKSGEGHITVLLGDAGIGKSRLTRAVIDTLSAEPLYRLLFQCSPHHGSSILRPVLQRLARVANLEPAEPVEHALDKLERVLTTGTADVPRAASLIAPLLGLDGEARYGKLNLSPAQHRARALEVLVDQLAGMARRRPLLLILEDVHWIDATTLELLDLAIDRLSALPVLVLLTARPAFGHRFGGHPAVSWLTLGRLARLDVRAIALCASSGRTWPDDVVAMIGTRTGGVPLFVEELTKAILESGALRQVGDALVLDRPLGEVMVPTSLHDSLMARLDRFPGAKEIAQVAACIGREFDYRLLQAVASVDEAALRAHLSTLVSAELVFVRGAPPDASYVFKHALIRDAAFESVLKSQRRVNHAKIADYLATHAPDVAANAPETLAHHFSMSGQPQHAVVWWARAGNRALQHSANVEAINHFQAALKELAGLPGPGDPQIELAVQIGLGSALAAVRGYSHPATGAAYRRGLELATRLNDIGRLVPVLYGLWNLDNNSGRLDGAEVKAREMVEVASRHQETGPLVAALSALGTTLTFQGRWTEALAYLRRTLDLYRIDEHASLRLDYSEDPAVQAHINSALCLWNLGDRAAADREMTAGIGLARKIDHVNSLAFALIWRCLLDYFIGDAEQVARSVEEATVLLRQENLPLWEAFAQIFDAWSAMHRQPGLDRSDAVRDGIARFREMDGGVLVPCFLGLYADALILVGRLDAALAALAEAHELVAANNEHNSEAEILRLRARALLAADPTAIREAEASLEAALEGARTQQARIMQLRVALDLAKLRLVKGEAAAAAAVLAEISSLSADVVPSPELSEARILLEGS